MKKERENETVPSFEEAIAKLEKIVADMEGGKVGLEKSMELFEEGSRLAKFCIDRLGETEKRIEMLMRQAGGKEPEWQDVTERFANPEDRG